MQSFRFLRENAACLLFVAVYTAAFFVFVKTIFFTIPFLLGLLLCSAALPLCRFFEHYSRVSRKAISLFTTVLLFSVVLFLLIVLLLWLLHEVRQLAAGQGYFRFDELSPNVQAFFAQFHHQFPAVNDILSDFLRSGFTAILPFLGKILRFFLSVPSVLLVPFLIFLTAYTALVHHRNLRHILIQWIPLRFLRPLRRVLRQRSGTTAGLLVSYITLYLITFSEVCVVLCLLELPYPLITALLAAISDFIPVLGPGAILLPLSVYRFLCGDTGQALGLIFGWLLITVVRQIVEPRLLSQITRTPTLLLLASVYVSLICGSFWPIPYTILLSFIINLFRDAGLLPFKQKDIRQT